MFASAREEIVPDILCLGKGLGGGLPLSACLGPAEVMDAWPRSEGEALHTSTFLGHPLACAAGLALLDVLESERLVDRAKEEGEWFRTRLTKALHGHPHIGDVRGRGLLVGIELVLTPAAGGEAGREGVGPATTGDPTAVPPPDPGAGVRAAARALEEGLMILPAGDHSEVVELSPPLTTSRVQLEWAVEALVRTFATPSADGRSGR
jgi:4-aminobutyrate aminotransferase/(S)-3-amino-2-methylpropionate transaminase